jgi:hypothetical protein
LRLATTAIVRLADCRRMLAPTSRRASERNTRLFRICHARENAEDWFARAAQAPPCHAITVECGATRFYSGELRSACGRVSTLTSTRRSR